MRKPSELPELPELPEWFKQIIYRLQQSWMTISVNDISQLNLSKDLLNFFENILSIVKNDAGKLARSELVDQIIGMGVKEIEEKISAIELVIEKKQPKISNQYVTYQLNFFGNNRFSEDKSKYEADRGLTTVTTLCKAFSSQSFEECQTLLAGFNLANIDDLDDATGDTVLICAVRSAVTLKDIPQAVNKIRLLLAHKASVNGCSEYGSTALHAAAKLNLKELCSLLVESGASLLIMNKGHESPIHLALASTHIELAKYFFDLLGHYRFKFLQQINPQNKNTILHFVNKSDLYSDFLKHIISRCLPILECRNTLGQTPLLSAVRSQRYSAMEILIRAGASVMAEVTEFVDDQYWRNDMDARHNPYFMGATTLHLANHQLLEYLLHQPKYPDINDANNSHRCSPLHSAVLARDLEKVLLLRKHGADIQQKNEEGHTPFHLAAISISEEIGYYLIFECPVLLLAQDKYGMTALHWAILKGNQRFVALTLYLAKLFDLDNQLLNIRVTAEKVVVMENLYRIKGFNYLDLFNLPSGQVFSRSTDISPLLKEGEYFAEQLRISLLTLMSPSDPKGIRNIELF